MNTTVSSTDERNITDINRSFEERDTQEKASKASIPYIDLEGFPINQDALRLLRKDQAEKAQAVVFDRMKSVYKIAIVDPQAPGVSQIVQSFKDDGYEVSPFMCSPSGMKTVLQGYEADLMNKKSLELREDYKEAKTEDKVFTTLDFKEKEAEIAALPSPQAFHEIILSGLKYKASDIHFQPGEKGMDIRFRVDGILHNIFHFSEEFSKSLVIRAKYCLLYTSPSPRD